MGVITRAVHPAALWPGVKGFFGHTYKELEQQWSQLFETITSDKAYEEFVETTGFGLLPVKTEGGPIAYDQTSQGYTARLTNVMYGGGFMVTLEEIQDNKYKQVGERRAGMLAFSLRQTMEVVHANHFVRAFSTSYPIGDGKAWLDDDHPTRSGDQSNILAVSADLSEAAVTDLCTQIRRAKNNRGLKIRLQPQRLIIPPQLEYVADRLINSEKRAGTANNDKNVLRGKFPKGVFVYDYIDSDSDAWFVQTDAPTGLVHAERMAPSLEKDEDFDTTNAKARILTRFLSGPVEWRGMYGSPGI